MSDESFSLTTEQIKQIEKVALRKAKKKFLEIDKEEVWVSYLTEAREKDPYESFYDNNYNI